MTKSGAERPSGNMAARRALATQRRLVIIRHRRALLELAVVAANYRVFNDLAAARK